jgi:hypothetical protein
MNLEKQRRNEQISGHMWPTKIEATEYRNWSRLIMSNDIKAVIRRLLTKKSLRFGLGCWILPDFKEELVTTILKLFYKLEMFASKRILQS